MREGEYLNLPRTPPCVQELRPTDIEYSSSLKDTMSEGLTTSGELMGDMVREWVELDEWRASTE